MYSEYNIKQYNADTYNISDPDILEIIWLAYKQGHKEGYQELVYKINKIMYPN